MKVTFINKYTVASTTIELIDYIERRLYENRDGAIETATANIETCQGAMARLLEILVSKNIISLADVVKIVDGCEEFIE